MTMNENFEDSFAHKEQESSDNLKKPAEENIVIRKKHKRGILAILAAAGVLLKGKWVLALLSKAKFIFVILKLSKFGATAISMVVTIAMYAVAYGFSFAVGFVALIFLHELGHYFTARKMGLAVSGPVFIPFIGAFIGMKEEPKDAVTEAIVGYAGPFFGTLAAVVPLIIFWLTGYKLALALAYTGFLLNLFNLIPVYPLDGGRVVTAISPYLWLIGIPVMVYILIISFNPLLLIILFFGIIKAYKSFRTRQVDHVLTTKTKTVFSLLYFGLVGILGIAVSHILPYLSIT